MKTKIFHIVENFDNKYGGVNVVVKSIVNNIIFLTFKQPLTISRRYCRA